MAILIDGEWGTPEALKYSRSLAKIRAAEKAAAASPTPIYTQDQDTGGLKDWRQTTTKPAGPVYDPNAAARREAAAAQAKANAVGKSRSDKQNQATRSLADQQYALLASFGQSRDTKIANIAQALKGADKLLLENYATVLEGLLGSAKNNAAAEADNSFANIANAVRERGDIMGEAAANGAGETDLLRAQLAALRNYDANQNETNRSFFDTLNSINSATGSLNTDTATSRANLFNQSQSDIESTWSNYYNQVADTWTQIGNIENSNTNVKTDSSNAYDKAYGQSASEAAKAAASSYRREGAPEGYTEWSGKGAEQDAALTSSNKAATVNLGAAPKRPEGATLRKW